MAKILFGAGVGDARGSVGAATFTKGRYGAVLRQKVSPVQPRSASVMNIRALFHTLSKNWANSLTDADRAGWNALAAITSFTNAFGNTYHPTGLQLYQLCNRNLQLIGSAVISTAPANLDVQTPLTLVPAASAGGATLTLGYTVTPVPADHALCFDASPQFNFGRSFVGDNYRFIGAVGPGVASPNDAHAAYIARFGALRLNCKVGFRCWLIKSSTGAASQPITALATVAA